MAIMGRTDAEKKFLMGVALSNFQIRYFEFAIFLRVDLVKEATA